LPAHQNIYKIARTLPAHQNIYKIAIDEFYVIYYLTVNSFKISSQTWIALKL
jgi:hypothetical protein